MIETTFVKYYSQILCDMHATEWEIIENLDNPDELANRIMEYLRQ